MEISYSLFIATDEMFTCRAIARYGRRHDYTLTLGSPGDIQIILPNQLTTLTSHNMYLVYNPHMLDIFYARIVTHSDKTQLWRSLQLGMVPRELGCTNLGITIDDDSPAYNLESLVLRLDAETQPA